MAFLGDELRSGGAMPQRSSTRGRLSGVTCPAEKSARARERGSSRGILGAIEARGAQVGRIDGPRESGWILEPLSGEVQECAVVMSIDVHSRFREVREVARGDQEHVEIPIPFAIRAAALAASRWCVLAHNHPSGDPAPSDADVRLWHQAAKQFACAGLRLLDHLVIARGAFYSCAWQSHWTIR